MATLYVNATGGDDSRSYATAQNSSTPWLTIGRAAWGTTNPNSPNASLAAQAGDLVSIAAGTYTTDGIASGGRFDVALNPANSGTSGNPITFRGVGTVNVRMTSGHTGPTIGANAKDYIVWDNITIDDQFNGSVSDTGPVVFHTSVGSQLLNSSITGIVQVWADNYNGVRLQETDGILIKNNYIQGFTGAGGANCAGIMMYGARNTIIEHNDLSASNTNIYVKGDLGGSWPQHSNIIRFNRIHDSNGATGRGIELHAADRLQIYQNILKGNAYAFRMKNEVAPQSSNITIQNNTVISTDLTSDRGFLYNETTNYVAMRAFNNIFYGSFNEVVYMRDAAALGDQSFEHNLYHGYNTWGSLASSSVTFATWQGTHGQDSASPAGTTSDPLFVDEIDYKLTGSSPAKNLGVDILDLDGDTSTTDNVDAGAYITGNETIGVESGSAENPVLAASSACAIGRYARWI